jgi:hypothetical protein
VYNLLFFKYLELFHSEISFDENEEDDIIIRAWELSKRILIYCLYVTLPLFKFHVCILLR